MARIPSSVVAALLLAACIPCEAQRRADYLKPDLRSRVEALKEEVATAPTDAATLERRAALLWEWANQFALDGGNIPVNLPSRITEVGRVRFDRSTPPPNLLRDIDRFTVELALKEERPDAIGTLRFKDQQPLVAASFATVEQTYVVGARALEPGAAPAREPPRPTRPGPPPARGPGGRQLRLDPRRAGRQRRRPERVRWEKLRLNLPHSNRQEPAFRLASGRLAPGETVTFTYGDRSGGSRGFQIQSFQTDMSAPPRLRRSRRRRPLPLAALAADHGRRPAGGEAGARARAVGGRARRALRALGAQRGRVVQSAVGSHSRLYRPPRREAVARAAPVERAVQLIRDARVEKEGVHRFTVRTADGALSATSNPVWAKENPERRVYWGETHGHCGFGEGQGSVESFYRFGRDDARLDFQTLTEHDAMLDDWEWSQINEQARRFHEDGSFVTFVGYEWSAQRTEGGHHNVIFREPGPRRVPLQTHPVLPLLYGGLRVENDFEDVLIIPHAHNAGDWTRTTPSSRSWSRWPPSTARSSGSGTSTSRADSRSGSWAPRTTIARCPACRWPCRNRSRRRTRASPACGRRRGSATQSSMRCAHSPPTRRPASASCSTPRSTVFPWARDSRTRRSGGSSAGRRDQPDRPHRGGEERHRRVRPELPGGAARAARSTLQIGFESSSEVFFPPRDNPRPQRVWKGTLDVEGARVVGLSTPGFDNHYKEFARLDESDPNRIRFSVRTRGRMDTLLLELDGATSRRRSSFHLEERAEEGSPAGNERKAGGDPRRRLHAGRSPTFATRGSSVRSRSIGTPTASSSRSSTPAARWIARSSSAISTGPPRPHRPPMSRADYYYVRVTQLDGGLAFSSPFWVGRKDS